jgi:dihydrodipicolinate synthase/N-acetylneuraminate lyase
MVNKKFVVAIPPSYDQEQNLKTDSTSEYVKYLHAHGATTVMTTAGTSQFNLLSTQEIHQLNQSIIDGFDGVSIVGVPGVSTKDACSFVENTEQYRKHNTHVMALYPDRFYDKDTVIDYVSRISDAWGGPVYLHTPKMRKGTGGDWNYTAEVVNELYDKDKLAGIKEEHSDLSASYNFVAALNKRIDVFVAGGSMRRFNYLESAGANAFLSGIGNLFPEIETKFLNSHHDWYESFLQQETKFFNTFLKYGWHASLRSALKLLGLTCFNNRSPWPELSPDAEFEIMNIIKELKDAG